MTQKGAAVLRIWDYINYVYQEPALIIAKLLEHRNILQKTATSCKTEEFWTHALLQPDDRGQTFSQLLIKQVSRRNLERCRNFNPHI